MRMRFHGGKSWCVSGVLLAVSFSSFGMVLPYWSSQGEFGKVDIGADRRFTLPDCAPSAVVKAENGPAFNVYYLDVINHTGIGFDFSVAGPEWRACLEGRARVFIERAR